MRLLIKSTIPGGGSRATRVPLLPERRVSVAANRAADYVTFGGALAALRSRARILALCIGAGGALAAIAYFTERPVYRATTSLEIQMPNDDYMNRRQLNPSMEPGAVMMEPFLQTQLKLIRSDALLWPVVQKLRLQQLSEFQAGYGWYRQARKRKPGKEEFLDAVRVRLDTRLAGQTQILEVSFEASDPQLAAQVANALANQYKDEAVKRRIDSATSTATILSIQIENVRASLLDAEKQLQKFVVSSGLLSGGEKDTVAEGGLRQIQTMLAAAEEARISDEAKYEISRATTNDAMETDALRGYRTRMTELRQQLAESSEVFQPAHYKVRQLKAELAEVEKAFERERQGMLQRLNNQYQTSAARERGLRSEYDRQTQAVARQMASSVRYTTLKRQVETQQGIYDSIIRKVREAGVLSAMQASNVRIVDPAEVPYLPVRPKLALYLAIGLSGGGFLGMLITFWTDRRGYLASNWAAHPHFSLRCLGVVPRFASRQRGEIPELAAWTSPKTPFAEAIQVISAQLFRPGESSWPHSIAISSAHRSEGKTTLACSLAISLSRAGSSVLLVDAADASHRIDEIFETGHNFRPSDPMAMSHDPEDALMSVWVTKIPNLSVLTRGVNAYSGAGLSALIKFLQTSFEFVILDAPALLPNDSASEIASAVDGTVMVICPDCTSRVDADEASGRLAVDGQAKLLGAVFNRAGAIQLPAPELEKGATA